MKAVLIFALFSLILAVSAQREYVVQPGDTLSSIAQKIYGDSSKWQQIYRDNRRTIGNNPDLIYPGMSLEIRVPSRYTVQSGDTLWGIAQKLYGNGNQWQKIYNANKSRIGNNPDALQPGQVLRIPR